MRSFRWLVGFVFATGCGGDVRVDLTAGPNESDGGNLGLGRGPGTPEADAMSSTFCDSTQTLRLVPISRVVVDDLGRASDVFRLSPDGSQLVLFQEWGQPLTSRLVDLDTGSVSVIERAIADRSADWSADLVMDMYGLGSNEAGLLSTGSAGELICGITASSRFDATGLALVDARCASGELFLSRTDITTGALVSEESTMVGCADGPVAFVPLTGGDVLFGNASQGSYVVGSDGEVRSADHLGVPDVYIERSMDDGAAISPDGRLLAVATRNDLDRTGTLSMYSYPELEPVADLGPVRWTRCYDGLYVDAWDALPMAWSPDGRFFATTDDKGGLVVRACGGAVLTTVSTADAADTDGARELSNATFSADGSRLATFWTPGIVQIYEVIAE